MDQSITITLQESCTSVQEMQVIGKWNSNPEEYDKIIIIIMNLGECSSLNQKRREKKKKNNGISEEVKSEGVPVGIAPVAVGE